MQLGFEHSYSALPDRFHARLAPTRVSAPRLVVFNAPLARELGLDPQALEPQAAELFSGNRLPDDAQPLAMAYAGHQFGNFVPQLGDGRAILLGEIRDRAGTLRDVQLKGSGLTPFSRSADGRAAIGPMLREYLVSESMHALGIPTTRSLAVVSTGDTVRREEPLPGAILTRIAASHIRVGTFEFFAARGDEDGVRALLDYVIERHYPEARSAANPALEVLRQVTERQTRLIAQWMGVGFIHGVMNTDNMTLSGETIDYGPCAFLDDYDPSAVFSSIDRRGRYAFGRQPAIAQWNLARLAETLVPSIAAATDEGVRLATEVVEPIVDRFDALYLATLRSKCGFAGGDDGDIALIKTLLDTMRAGRVDFTLAFRRLSDVVRGDQARFRSLFPSESAVDEWLPTYLERLSREASTEARADAMDAVNPIYIPRNHRVEAALSAATERGDYTPFLELLSIVQQPFVERPEGAGYETPPGEGERVLATFCGT
ncbi:MAG: protein adenylyltransferase SelO [Steroidobacteraceae bacterium]